MKVVVRSHIPLKNMKPGQIAITADGKDVYVCGLQHMMGSNKHVYLKLNNTEDQYSDSFDMQQLVRVLQAGEEIVLVV